MKGRWHLQERTQTWHLRDPKIDMAARSKGDPIMRVMWCGLQIDDKDPQKDGSDIDGRFDAVHDECFRKSEEL